MREREWDREGEREEQNFHPLIHSSDASNGSLTGVEAGIENPIQVFHKGGRDSITWAITAASLASGIEPNIRILEVSILTSKQNTQTEIKHLWLEINNCSSGSSKWTCIPSQNFKCDTCLTVRYAWLNIKKRKNSPMSSIHSFLKYFSITQYVLTNGRKFILFLKELMIKSANYINMHVCVCMWMDRHIYYTCIHIPYRSIWCYIISNTKFFNMHYINSKYEYNYRGSYLHNKIFELSMNVDFRKHIKRKFFQRLSKIF